MPLPKVISSWYQKTGSILTPNGLKTFKTGASHVNSGGAIKYLLGMVMTARSLWLGQRKRLKLKLLQLATPASSIVIQMFWIPGLALLLCHLAHWAGLMRLLP